MALLKGYLMPHAPAFIDSIGEDQLHQVSSTRSAMYKVAEEIAQLRPDVIIVISPHGPIFSDAIAIYDQNTYFGNFKAFGEYNLNYHFEKDTTFINSFKAFNKSEQGDFYCLNERQFKEFNTPEALDHGVLVPLHFISQRYNDFKLVAMSYGTFSYYRLMKNGELLSDFISQTNKRVVVIASGDMSHALKDSGPYAFHEDGRKFDQEMQKQLQANKPYEVFKLPRDIIENAKECGLRAYALLMGMLNLYKLNTVMYSYEAPFGVGYLVASLEILNESKVDEVERLSEFYKQRHAELRKNEDDLVTFTRRVIEAYTITGKRPIVSFKDDRITINDLVVRSNRFKQMSQIERGCFVSLNIEGSLRGCIGTIAATEQNVIYEIAKNAVSACSKDSRFSPVTIDELDSIEVKVDILSELNPVLNINQLNPRSYGIVVRKGYMQGLLLPNLDGINTVEQQLEIASSKGGFTVDEIEEILYFSVDRYQ
ncbi:MAG: hypothetical protein BGO41_15730 [Clostridiales bacterium 38-18]|nr:MAG: hypothetical protein BGO41_15730 [Clostridiales bacterium 38-18]